MDDKTAAKAFGCLGGDIRLRLFRRLIACGPRGDTPGRIAADMGLSPSGLSFHLHQLEDAGLALSWRVGRSLRYAADLHQARLLLTFFIEDCCRSDPRICGGLAALSAPAGAFDGEPAMSEDRVFNVLFLCTHNSARSIIAEGVMNRLGQGRFKAYSAGSQPGGTVHPYAIDILKNSNFPTADLRSKSWDEFAAPGAPEMDFVFTVCDSAAAETCPIWPGQPMSAHWGVPDPSAVEGSEAVKRAAFADAMRYMHNRISIFVNLPLQSVDRLALQERLDTIGKSAPTDAPDAAA